MELSYFRQIPGAKVNLIFVNSKKYLNFLLFLNTCYLLKDNNSNNYRKVFPRTNIIRRRLSAIICRYPSFTYFLELLSFLYCAQFIEIFERLYFLFFLLWTKYLKSRKYQKSKKDWNFQNFRNFLNSKKANISGKQDLVGNGGGECPKIPDRYPDPLSILDYPNLDMECVLLLVTRISKGSIKSWIRIKLFF